MSEVTVSIPQDVLQNEVLRLMAEKAIGQSIVNAVASSLSSYRVKEEVERALKQVMYEVARKHIESNEEVAGLVHKAVDESLTTDLLQKSVEYVISRLRSSGY